MTAKQLMDEQSIDRIAAALIERHHPLRVILAVWLAARERRRQRRIEASDVGLLNLSDRMRRDMGLPEVNNDGRALPIRIFNIDL
jgi:hypothetical protein